MSYLRRICWLVFVVVMSTFTLPAVADVLGVWKTPDGGLVSVYRCEAQVCAKVVKVHPGETQTHDVMNPRTDLRSRALCGLEVGHGFSLTDPDHAEGGELYDPNSGKTYKGAMTFVDGKLKLRGYIGVKMFGRTEVWTRAADSAATCGK